MKTPIKASSILAGFLATSAMALGLGFAEELLSPAARYVAAECRHFNALATQRLDASVCGASSAKTKDALLDRVEV